MYKNILLCLLLLFPISASATMDPSQWRREMLIGFDNDSFYTFEINRSQPGSYYEKKKSTNFIIYNKKTGAATKKTPIVDASFSLKDPEQDLWKAKYKDTEKIDLNKYFQDKNFNWFFPEDNSISSELNITNKGLIIKTKKGEKLLKYKVIPKYIFNLEFEEGSPRIVSVYMDSANLYILAQRGMSTDDANHIQEILLIDMKQYLDI